jgi:hypothetical protein
MKADVSGYIKPCLAALLPGVCMTRIACLTALCLVPLLIFLEFASPGSWVFVARGVVIMIAGAIVIMVLRYAMTGEVRL